MRIGRELRQALPIGRTDGVHPVATGILRPVALAKELAAVCRPRSAMRLDGRGGWGELVECIARDIDQVRTHPMVAAENRQSLPVRRPMRDLGAATEHLSLPASVSMRDK